MATTMQEFLADETEKACNKLLMAFQDIPQDKFLWEPVRKFRSTRKKPRSAAGIVTDIAFMNGHIADVIEEAYLKENAEIFGLPPLPTLEGFLIINTNRLITLIRVIPDDVLDREANTDFGKMTMKELLAYPYWKMTYALGQVNYIAGLLGK